MENQDKLSPCPFCGATPHLVEMGELTGIECGGDCDQTGLCIAFSSNKKETAIAAWNARVNMPVSNTVQSATGHKQPGHLKAFLNAADAAGLTSLNIKFDGETQPQPELTVSVHSYPESNGKRNWTGLIHPVKPWDGLVGSCGGIVISRGEYWNRVAYAVERARFMLGLRSTEPFILDYGDDVETPDQWKGETCRSIPTMKSTSKECEVVASGEPN